MKLHELQFNEGARSSRKRLGRGQGSGQGKTAGKGHKGQIARSGGGVPLGFEGGQTPLFRRIPKRGFTNHTRKEFAIVNVSALELFEDGTVVTPALLIEVGLIKKTLDGIKILGDGELSKKLSVSANKFSKSAVIVIEKAGGSVVVI